LQNDFYDYINVHKLIRRAATMGTTNERAGFMRTAEFSLPAPGPVPLMPREPEREGEGDADREGDGDGEEDRDGEGEGDGEREGEPEGEGDGEGDGDAFTHNTYHCRNEQVEDPRKHKMNPRDLYIHT